MVADIKYLKHSLETITKDFEGQTEMAKIFQETYFKLEEMIQELEEHFKQVSEWQQTGREDDDDDDDVQEWFITPRVCSLTSDFIREPDLELPLLSLLSLLSQVTEPLMKVVTEEKDRTEPRPSPEDLITRTVSINNLNEFMCESVVVEYLRQNGIQALKCVQSLGYNERSRNFLVTIRQPDMERLLDPDLWPKGVTLSVRGEYKIPSIHGKREKDLPGVIISPGMSYWHSWAEIFHHLNPYLLHTYSCHTYSFTGQVDLWICFKRRLSRENHE